MKIAIITSSPANQALPLKHFFSGGNRISVDLIITDSEAIAANPGEIPTILCTSADDAILLIPHLKEEGIELIVADNFKGPIPMNQLEQDDFYSQRIIRFEQKEDGECTAMAGRDVLVTAPEYTDTLLPRAIVSIADRALHPTPPPLAPSHTPDSIEEEWAHTLNIPTPSPTITPSPTVPPNPTITPPPTPTPSPTPPTQPSMPPTYLLWSVLAIIFCCFIPAIVALIFSTQVSSKYYAGDYAGSRRASRNAQIWIIVSIVTGIVAATLYIPFMMLSA